MSPIILQSKSGPDGKLRLEISVDQPDTMFDVEVVVSPRKAVRTFPPGYFDLIGSVDDETLTVHPQPPMQPPLKIE